jgi:hypothetical protein
MHDIILQGLSSLNCLSSEQEMSNFLRELRPIAKLLWKAYRSNVVNVSYRKQTVQAAYMLGSFPHHAEVTRVILDELYGQGGHCHIWTRPQRQGLVNHARIGTDAVIYPAWS